MTSQYLGGDQSERQGAGEGLALHSTMLAIVGGTLLAEPAGEHGTRVIVRLPVGEGVG